MARSACISLRRPGLKPKASLGGSCATALLAIVSWLDVPFLGAAGRFASQSEPLKANASVHWAGPSSLDALGGVFDLGTSRAGAMKIQTHLSKTGKILPCLV
jgi:hypothetical protein